jgi:hypothetical protein
LTKVEWESCRPRWGVGTLEAMTARKRHSPGQVVGTLGLRIGCRVKGNDIADVCRQLGVSERR